MDYQLVLQFRGNSLADYDAMVALENDLIAELGDSAEVDGHDVGSGETNIFIITADPVRTFRQSMVVLERKRCLGRLRQRIARSMATNTPLVWPKNSTKDFRIV